MPVPLDASFIGWGWPDDTGEKGLLLNSFTVEAAKFHVQKAGPFSIRDFKARD
jgi:hypothetical protein